MAMGFGCNAAGVVGCRIIDSPRERLMALLTNSFVMAVGNLPVTLTLVLVWALAGVGCFYLSGVFFVWVGLAIFASSYFVDMVFKKYTGELAEEEAAWKQKQEERRQRRKLQKNKML